ncbi:MULTISPECIES: hypothetical protein [Trichocoleus]|uniref:Uncharacterized protein n=1 Tax=Trichocoleus desertorum GB2-A4 TaxID=2933944 RepID=A0ABV0JCS5_9CYAN|nr:hypothetical protein [Trichocoleus sp. FACHB-46]MBD1864216.1 hypothetical protein [Trichocoleus sp. FACHB-46]
MSTSRSTRITKVLGGLEHQPPPNLVIIPGKNLSDRCAQAQAAIAY